MLFFIKNIIILLLIFCIFGYINVVLRQKFLLKKNIILIDKKSITDNLIKKADLKEFLVDGSKLNSGDEIVIVTKEKEKIKGILIGIAIKEKSIILVTHNDVIKELDLKDLNKIKLISKYGYFF